MGFMALFTMGTGGHYITMLYADWSISTSHDPLPSSCHSERCYGIHLQPTHLLLCDETLPIIKQCKVWRCGVLIEATWHHNCHFIGHDLPVKTVKIVPLSIWHCTVVMTLKADIPLFSIRKLHINDSNRNGTKHYHSTSLDIMSPIYHVKTIVVSLIAGIPPHTHTLCSLKTHDDIIFIVGLWGQSGARLPCLGPSGAV